VYALPPTTNEAKTLKERYRKQEASYDPLLCQNSEKPNVVPNVKGMIGMTLVVYGNLGLRSKDNWYRKS
jgi:hypothetical protein